MIEKMNPEERIALMKENLDSKFEDEAKEILRDGKILKGEDAREHFNTELNELTFEMEILYPLNYEEFKKEFPRTIELVSKVSGNNVVSGVKKGIVIQGWSLKSNVEKTIENIKKNVKDSEKAAQEIALRKNVLTEITRMKEEFDIEWCQDLFWKCWKIKEGEIRQKILEENKGKKRAEKRINTLKTVGGLLFLHLLQEEIYPRE